MIVTEKFISSLFRKAIPECTEVIPCRLGPNSFSVSVASGDNIVMISIACDASKSTLASVIAYIREVFSKRLEIA